LLQRYSDKPLKINELDYIINAMSYVPRNCAPENYIQEIKIAEFLLADRTAKYSQLQDKLCELERLYGKLQALMSVGFAGDVITLLKIAVVADKIRFKIDRRVKKLADKQLGRDSTKPNVTDNS